MIIKPTKSFADFEATLFIPPADRAGPARNTFNRFRSNRWVRAGTD